MMDRSQLRQWAKRLKIKYYYRMNKHDLRKNITERQVEILTPLIRNELERKYQRTVKRSKMRKFKAQVIAFKEKQEKAIGKLVTAWKAKSMIDFQIHVTYVNENDKSNVRSSTIRLRTRRITKPVIYKAINEWVEYMFVTHGYRPIIVTMDPPQEVREVVPGNVKMEDLPLYGIDDKIYRMSYEDDMISDEYNVNKGECVPDMLYHLYGAEKGFIKLFKNGKRPLMELLGIDDLTRGVTPNMLIKFADKMQINYKCVDIDGETVVEYHPQKIRTHHVTPHVFVTYQEHAWLFKNEDDLHKHISKLNRSRQSVITRSKYQAEVNTENIWDREVVLNPCFDDVLNNQGKMVIFDSLRSIPAATSEDEQVNIKTIYCVDEFWNWRLSTEKYIECRTKWRNRQMYQLTTNDVIVQNFPNYEMTVLLHNAFNLEFKGEPIEQMCKRLFNFYDKDTNTIREDICSSLKTKVYQKCNGQCKTCGSSSNLHYDHIIPVKQGGKTEIDNLQLLCDQCNLQKGDKHNEFDQLLSEYNCRTRPLFLPTSKDNEHVPNNTNVNTAELINAYDINKCYTYCLESNAHDWIVLESTDEIEAFDGQLRTGMYKIENIAHFDDGTYKLALLLILGNDTKWFTVGTIKYLLSLGFTFDITYQLIPRKNVIKHDKFKSFVNFVYDKAGGNAKFVINAFIGQLGKTEFHVDDYHRITTMREAKCLACQFRSMGKCKTIQIPNTDKVHFISEKQTELLMNARPVRQQVLENCAMLLMDTMLKSKTPLRALMKVKTDELHINAEMSHGMDEYMKTQTSERGMLRCSQRAQPFKPFAKDTFEFCRNAKHSDDDDEIGWLYNEVVTDTPDEQLAQRIYNTGKSLLVKGIAGAGKTYFIKNEFIPILEANGLKYKKIAYTNQACRLLKGQTFHKTFNIGQNKTHFNRRSAKYQTLSNLDYLIVDEVSMITYRLWQQLLVCKKEFPQLKIMLLGDFDQLPPVESEDITYEDKLIVKEIADFRCITFTKNMRSDEELFDVYRRALFDGMMPKKLYKPRSCSYINLCYTHARRKRIITECLERWFVERDGVEVLKYSDYCDYSKLRNPDLLQYHQPDFKVSKDMVVISKSNDPKSGYYNSERYVVTNFNEREITITNKDDDEIVITISNKQFFQDFVSAFAVTYHKSQGLTINEPYCIHELFNKRTTKNMKYVVLSRATSINNISIVS